MATGHGIFRALGGKDHGGGRYMCHCPSHDDANPSLSVTDGPPILVKCFAGCDQDAVIEALKNRGLWPKRDGGTTAGQFRLPEGIPSSWYKKYFASHWVYRNEAGEVVGYVVRYENPDGDKDVIPFFRKDSVKWKSGFPKTADYKRPIYNLDTIAQAQDNKEIWVTEGEKPADALAGLGLLATTSPGGVHGAAKADWSLLQGRKIILWPDNDPPGRTYITNVYHELTNQESDPAVEVVDVSKLDLRAKDDAYDWVEKGNTSKDINDLTFFPIGNLTDLGAVVVEQGSIHVAVDEVEELLAKKAPYIVFDRGGSLTKITKLRDIDKQSAIRREAGSVILEPVSKRYLEDLFDKNINFFKFKEKKGLVPIDPPGKLADRFMARSGEWQKIHVLRGIIHAPTLRQDGSILQRAGYDEVTGLYFSRDKRGFMNIPENPSRDDALAALQYLKKPLEEFPFVSRKRDTDEVAEDEAVVLAAILTVLVRKSIRSAPLFAFDAPMMGSGKSLLADLVSIIAMGRNSPFMTQTKNKEEERKHLFSLLLSGDPILTVDNCEDPVQSATLCAILTTDTYRDRILGRSQSPVVPTAVTFLCTGNNLVFAGDMTSRALICTIDPKMEKPEERSFIKKDLRAWVKMRRSKLAVMGLKILRAYHVAGRPKQPIKQFGRFEEWSDWVRSALVWVGCADPCKTRERIEESDPETTQLRRLLSLLRDVMEDHSFYSGDLADEANNALEHRRDEECPEVDLAKALLEVAPDFKGRRVNTKKLGWWLRGKQNRIIDGLRLVKDPSSPKSQQRWKVVEV